MNKNSKFINKIVDIQTRKDKYEYSFIVSLKKKIRLVKY